MLGDEEFEPSADGIANLTKDDGLIRDGSGGRIRETLVDTFAGARKDGAGFARVVANGDDVVEGVVPKFVS